VTILPTLIAQSDIISDVAWLNGPTVILMGVVLVLLTIAFGVGHFLKRQPDTAINPAVVSRLNSRVQAWWIMFAIVITAFLFQGPTPVVVLFGLLSFAALREFITLTPTRMGDHRALFWVFFFIAPLQYVLVGMGREYYDAYCVMIPVLLLFIPARIALAGDFKRFLERTAKIQASLLICVYALSFAPALLYLDLVTLKQQDTVQTQSAEENEKAAEDATPEEAPPGDATGAKTADAKPIDPIWHRWRGSNAGLLFYFILIVQLSDVFQYTWDKLLGRRVIAPAINASRTWEGLFGAIFSTALAGSVLSWVTPFTFWQSACMSLIIAMMGFAGGLTMSAIKRDRGVEDYGTLVEGHAGVLDRIDSVCFAAPVFFFLTRYFFGAA
jgi:phosphatidate cytidylyltransferase